MASLSLRWSRRVALSALCITSIVNTCDADTITLSGFRSATTPTQSGWYYVSTGFFGGNKTQYWIDEPGFNVVAPSPKDPQPIGFVWTDVPTNLGTLNLQAGSTIHSAVLSFTWGPHPTLNDQGNSISKKSYKYNAEVNHWEPTGHTDDTGIATDFTAQSLYLLNWINIDGAPRWFSPGPMVPNPSPGYVWSGSIDLLAAGLGPYITPTSSFALGGNMQISVYEGKAFVHTGSRHKLVYEVSAALTNALSAQLDVQYTAPPPLPPSDSPEPTSFALLIAGVGVIGLLRRRYLGVQ